ncbi:MAG: hypothetical protein O2958_14310 [Gemmatimonadetes bacterium]|nr:hypothetical protein [Gemmatimonadota bacterium]
MSEKEQRKRQRLAAAGIEVDQAEFFAGHLRTPEGESVYLAARREAGAVALRLARELVEGSPVLRELDAAEGRGTVRLYLAKQLQWPVGDLLTRVYVARALAGVDSWALWLEAPSGFSGPEALRDVPDVDVRFYPGRKDWGRSLLRIILHELARRVRALLSFGPVPEAPGPSVLLTHEDDLHTDRTIRGQPHWLHPDDPPPPFEVFVVTRGRSSDLAVDPDLDRLRVRALPRRFGSRAALRHRTHPALRRLRRDATRCLRGALGTSDSVARTALAHTWRLFVRAEEMAGMALQLGARTFVSGEPYLLEVDAMQLAAERVGVRTSTYQYSNLAYVSPLMLSTSDEMSLFSSNYEGLWNSDGIRPGRFRVGGYPIDGVAGRVRGRSADLRMRLEGAGARFVLCYFDESVQKDRWGLVSEADHRAELEQLARLVLSDPRFGLIVKSQFERNSPSRLYPEDPLFQSLIQTGRYEELRLGTHRNVVFPVEAALAADLSIGHLFGATATLEAAVAGCRAVLLNPFGLRTPHDHVYRQARIVFPDLGSLVEAVRDEVDGSPPQGGRVGDWGAIIDYFDPIRDGRAAERMRNWVTETTLRGADSRGGRPAP